MKTAWLYPWLQIVLFLLFLYSLVLVFAGSIAGDLFSLLGFGPVGQADTEAVREYLRLPYMVLGAVLAGWSLTLIQIVRGPLRSRQQWAWGLMFWPLLCWFFLDTGMSLVLGFPTHALFNLPFALALIAPLLLVRRQFKGAPASNSN